MFKNEEEEENKGKKAEESMASIREKQRRLFNEDIKKSRREMLQIKRFETFNQLNN